MANSADLLVEALHLPHGAQFYKCALQVNPFHYLSTFRGESIAGNPASHAKEIVARAIDLGIKVLAITDHNCARGVREFRTAARGHDLHIFPGFELSSSEGVHVLCIYGPDTSDQQLERFLGSFGVDENDQPAALARATFSQILKDVHDQGGLAIAAHITNSGGLFKVLSGQARIRAWRDENLLAVQVPGSIDGLEQGHRDILLNRNPDYCRSSSLDNEPAVAAINAKDVTRASDLEDGRSTCLIKMSDIGISGLRQAFLDPGSRIRLNADGGIAECSVTAELVALVWEGGFLDGARVHLNANLNVLIGGRGTGKSTIIESIRLALGLDPVGEEARRAYTEIKQHVLRNGTRIALTLRIHRPSSREYRIERVIPNPPRVHDASGVELDLTPTDIMPGVEVYGQHEIAELARSPEKLTHLLGRFVAHEESAAKRKAELRRDLKRNRIEIGKTLDEIDLITERLVDLPGIEETLKHYRESGIENRLLDQSMVVREEGIVNSIGPRLEPVRDALEALCLELPIDRKFVSKRALGELPGAEILSRTDKVLSDLDKELQTIADSYRMALDRADRQIAKVRSDWESRKNAVQAEYERVLRDLQKEDVDGTDFIRLRRQVEELRLKKNRLELLQGMSEEQFKARQMLLEEWDGIKSEELDALKRAARKVSRKLPGRLAVDVRAGTDLTQLSELIREEIGGRMKETIQRFQEKDALFPRELAKAIRSGQHDLANRFSIPSRQAERLAGASRELIMRIEELDFTPDTTVRLNTAPRGAPESWKGLGALSAGQKATAILLLLLLDSDAPLIVDQPEDDLDNRFITESIVPRMREEKQRRQFIFATHNANIPVLGDAELIVGLSAQGENVSGQARIPADHMGSIDSERVRLLVEDILEGGREAFERRRRKYGF